MKVLAGDIGGTKTIIALAEVEGVRVTLEVERRFDSKAYARLEDIVAAFLAETRETGERACFGIAGPVERDVARATNLPWVVDARAMERALGIGPTRLLNDFKTAAYGVECLGPDDVTVLNEGVEVPGGPRAMLGAGTGLGEALLYHDGDHYEVLASEGGHGDFAPRDELQIGLLRWLLARYEHVSYERVVSGPGLVNCYDYLRDAGVVPEAPAVREAMAREDRGSVIGRHGVAGDDALCVRALDLFGEVYGAEAGNLALKVLATGGVYLAGGIAGKVLPRLAAGSFMAGFTAKGRMSKLVAAMPVRVATNAKVGLLGAAAAAARIPASGASAGS